MKIREMLKGCVPGRLQSVGYMTIVPLVSDLSDDRFLPADECEVSTAGGYGNLVFKNDAAQTVIVPSGAAYITNQKAQDHAMAHVGVVAGKRMKNYATASCVQRTQGGMIAAGKHEMMIMPVPIRSHGHAMRRKVEYGKLWPAIQAFNQKAGVADVGGHLAPFFTHFKDQLDSFVAEFEPVPGQVGCIVLIDGDVVGVERCPSWGYFRSVWRPLIRECYGSLAAVKAAEAVRIGSVRRTPKTRVPLREASSLDDLREALDEAETEEKRRVGKLVEAIMDVDLAATQESDEETAGLTVMAVGDKPYVGQVVSDGGRVVYASLVASEKGGQRDDWLLAEDFSMA